MKAHVRQRGHKFAVVVEVGADPVTGKRRQRWISGFATQAAAEEALRKILSDAYHARDPFPVEMLVRDFVNDRWLPGLEKRGKLRPNTIRNYRQIMRDHILPSLGALELRKVRVAHVDAVLDAMQDKGRAARTVCHARACMSAMFREALRKELIASNPARDSLAPEKQKPVLRTPTANELRAIVETARGTTWEIPLLLSARTGARRGEVLGLKWGSVDLDAGHVRITESLSRVAGKLVYGPPKSESAVRTVPLSPDAIERLRAHKAAQARRLWPLGIRQTDETPVVDRGDGQPVDPATYTHAASRIMEKAGVKGARLHDIRHAVLSALAALGDLAIASEIAGHASMNFTHAVYVHGDAARVARHAEALERALGGAG